MYKTFSPISRLYIPTVMGSQKGILAPRCTYSICQMQQTKDGLNHSVIHYFPLYPLLALNLIFTKRAVRAGVLELQIEGR